VRNLDQGWMHKFRAPGPQGDLILQDGA